MRDFAKLRIDRANARMIARQDGSRDSGPPADPVARLRDRADTMATMAAAMKRIADAADPLYKTLDDGQKRRLAVLTHMEGRFGGRGWRHHRFQRGMDRDDGGRDRDRLRPGRRTGQGSRRPGRPRAALDAARLRSIQLRQKPPESGGFFAFPSRRHDRGIPRRFAGHRGIALLNDALLRRLFRAGSGRIAQLVEQMTLNHRVPGSSPGAPTKLFKKISS